jgi:ABC transporter substrate binding protein
VQPGNVATSRWSVMRRRYLLAILGGALLLLPLTGTARDEKMPTVGVLVVGVPDPGPFLRAFRESLHKAGYNEKDNIQLDIRSAEGKAKRLPKLARELVDRKVDVIVALQTPALEAAKQATTEIPIVMDAGDPVGMGLVASLARPGGNITGMTARTAELAPKILEFAAANSSIMPAGRAVSECNGSIQRAVPGARQLPALPRRAPALEPWLPAGALGAPTALRDPSHRTAGGYRRSRPVPGK